MTVPDVRARLRRLTAYRKAAMAREPGTDPMGIPEVKIMRQSFDGTPAWAQMVDKHLERYWPGEHGQG